MRNPPPKLGLPSGIALVVSSMVGAGVFLSTGFMAQDMGPRAILLAWVVGASLALCGARAYATVAELVPRSGGEYRYLSELWHPFLGYLAGWASLLLGFSAPIAVDAVAAGAFAGTLGCPVDPRITGAVVVVVLTCIHATTLTSSRWTQNLLLAVNGALLTGFVSLGFLGGSWAWPSWTPPNPSAGFALPAFAASLFYIAFAFSGWNATAYAAEEFREPRRTVPRAMLIGCALVGALYLMVNWVFVANLTPERARVVLTYETTRITLGHVVARDLAGEAGGTAMSTLALVAFVSAISAMIFSAPRMSAAMARDGFLPRALAGRPNRPPVGFVFLQGGLALVLIFTHELQQVLLNLGALLTFFAALTAAALFRVRFGARSTLGRPSPTALAAAAVYVLSASWMLYFGLRRSTTLLVWIAVVVAAAFIGFVVSRRAGHTRTSTGVTT